MGINQGREGIYSGLFEYKSSHNEENVELPEGRYIYTSWFSEGNYKVSTGLKVLSGPGSNSSYGKTLQGVVHSKTLIQADVINGASWVWLCGSGAMKRTGLQGIHLNLPAQ